MDSVNANGLLKQCWAGSLAGVYYYLDEYHLDGQPRIEIKIN